MDTSETEQPFSVKSYVSPTEAWHQELNFSVPCRLRIIVEHLSGGPIYGYYANQEDFAILEQGDTTNEISGRVRDHELFANETSRIERDVLFPVGTFYVCIELDCLSCPSADGAWFRLTLQDFDP